MLEKVIAQLRSEMDQNRDKPYIQVIGAFLMDYLKANPDAAEKIGSTDKSIGKSLDAMKKAAEKSKVGNCAVLTDQEGFNIVLKYFGVEGAAKENKNEASKIVQPQVMQKPEKGFDISLDDLLD